MSNQSSYSRYTNADDKVCVHNLLKLALANGNKVSVHDGEEWALKNSNSITEIKAALASTGNDALKIKDSDGKQLAVFWLIYNNGSEGDPLVCISDYTDNEFSNAVYNALRARLESSH